jgi:DNA-directed RNA polymerase specialized sigma24 family protein
MYRRAIKGNQNLIQWTPGLCPTQSFGHAGEEALRTAMYNLPETFRVPLLLFVAGSSYRQIAKDAQIKVGTVKSRICRAKALLRRRLRIYL